MEDGHIQICSVTKTFYVGKQPIEVLRGIDATFTAGTTYAIRGVSGTGKSTLLHILGLIDTPTQGQVLFNGRDVAVLDQAQREGLLQKSLGHIFQQPYLIDELSVRENLMLKAQIGGMNLAHAGHRADELLERVGLTDKAHALPRSLSGGQQQRVALIRAIMMRPHFVIADEPTGNLDEHMARHVIDLLIECVHEYNMGLIISTHDATVAARMDKVLRMHDGRLSPS